VAAAGKMWQRQEKSGSDRKKVAAAGKKFNYAEKNSLGKTAAAGEDYQLLNYQLPME
jgi:hypothetical protein